MVSVQWDQVFSNRRAVDLLRDFADNKRGFRNVIRSLKPSARTELYRLEREGVATARKTIRNVMKTRGLR